MEIEPIKKRVGKYRGRKKGSPNRKTLIFSEVLNAKGFDIPTKALELWDSVPEGALWYDVRIRLLEFLAKYVYPRPSIEINLDANFNRKPLDGFTTRELIEAIPTIDENNKTVTYGERSD